MLRIAVCDDDENDIKEISNVLSNYCLKKSIEHKILTFFDGCDLLNSYEAFDIIFLDIEMKHSNGIEIAQEIRETNMRVFIVYISNYPDNMRRAFKVHAFDFIKKPFVKEDIHIVMDDYFSTRHDGSDEMILLHTDNGAVQIRENEIYYFILRAKKKIFVRTADGDMIVREHVDNIYNKLDENLFFRSRRDCIVNLRYVETVRKDDFVIVTKDGSFLPLAQRKQAEFINKLSTAFVDKLKGKNHE